MASEPRRVLVVGGGAAGVVTAAALLREAGTRRRGRHGRGAGRRSSGPGWPTAPATRTTC